MIFDLIAGTSGASEAIWTPAELFLPGDIGAWYDGSDYSTMFMDVDGQLLITGPGQPVGLWKPAFGTNGFYFDLRQAIAASRPVTVTNSGKLAIAFDGVDDTLSSINSGASYDEVTMAIGFTNPNADAIYKSLFLINQDNGGNVLNLIPDQITGQTTILKTTQFGYSILSLNTVTNNTPQVGIGFAGSSSATPVTVRLNGIATENVPVYGRADYIQIDVSSAYLPITISQILFIDRVLTPSEITQLEAFIRSKQ